MAAATSQVFQQLSASWDTVATTSLASAVSSALIANATLLATMLTLWVIITGTLTMFSRMSIAEWVFGMTRCAIIGFLLTAAAFSQYIQTPLQTTIPNWMASSVSSNAAATGPQQFDMIYNQLGQALARVEQQLSWTDIGPYIECAFISFATLIMLIVSFAIWELAKFMIALLIVVAPFVMGLYIFRTTRHVPLNAAGAALGYLLMMLMVNIMVALTIAANTSFMQQIVTTGGVGPQIASLMNATGFIFFSDVMLIAVPLLAARLGGGVAHGGMSSPTRLGVNMLRGAANITAGAARGVNRIARGR